MNKIITAFFLTIFFTVSAFAGASSSKSDPKIEGYVDQLVAKVSTMLNDQTISEEQKVKKSRQLMAENLDLEWMAKYSLGRHRKELDMSQLKDFTKIYSSYVIKSYSDLVRNYKGQKAVVKKVSMLDDAEYIVKTEVVQSGQPPIKVDYLVRDVGASNGKKSSLKISDVITEGVSMINSQQAEFNSVISSGGIDALMTQLKAKI